MWKQVVRRLIVLCVMLMVVSVAAFSVPMLSGGDPARAILLSQTKDLAIDKEAIEATRERLGLDRPLTTQYLLWLARAAQGDFGYSFVSKQPVSAEIGRALGVSATLAFSALGFALLVAIPLGTLAAMRPGGRIDNLTTLMIQAFVAIPEYWFAPVSILIFALYLHLLPSAGWADWRSIILPALALTLRPMAYFTQIMRAAMLDVLGAPYITAARARGLTMNQAVARHGLRNGSLPVVTFFALWLASLLGGSVVIEVIFAIPGMGRLLYEAVINKDVPMLQGGFVAIVTLSVLVNTAADVLYLLVNPAMRGSHAR